MLFCDEYLTPGSLDEAFAAMERNRGRYRIVAGCTDTLPWAREGGLATSISRSGSMSRRFLNCANCTSMTAMCGSAPRRRSRASSTMRHSPRALPSLPRCAVWFADDQIRAQATVVRQYRQRLTGGGRDALPDRARGHGRAGPSATAVKSYAGA